MSFWVVSLSWPILLGNALTHEKTVRTSQTSMTTFSYMQRIAKFGVTCVIRFPKPKNRCKGSRIWITILVEDGHLFPFMRKPKKGGEENNFLRSLFLREE